jgi:hypothetical protein
MIALVAASAMYMIATQAVMNAPTNAFKDCLRQTSDKAKSVKIGPDAYEAYVRNACSAQLNTLTNVLISFETKNGMARKAAAEDAEMTVSDYVASSVDKYRFFAGMDAQEAKSAAAAAPPATPPPTPASAPQPPKK